MVVMLIAVTVTVNAFALQTDAIYPTSLKGVDDPGSEGLPDYFYSTGNITNTPEDGETYYIYWWGVNNSAGGRIRACVATLYNEGLPGGSDYVDTPNAGVSLNNEKWEGYFNISNGYIEVKWRYGQSAEHNNNTVRDYDPSLKIDLRLVCGHRVDYPFSGPYNGVNERWMFPQWKLSTSSTWIDLPTTIGNNLYTEVLKNAGVDGELGYRSSGLGSGENSIDYIQVSHDDTYIAPPPTPLLIDEVDSGMKLTWDSYGGASYDIEWTDSIVGDWTAMGLDMTGTSGLMSYVDSGDVGSGRAVPEDVDARFYRTVFSSGPDYVVVTPSDDFSAIIEGVSDSTTVVLTAGTFNITDSGQVVVLQNKSNITITGQGWDNTKLKLAPDVDNLFFLGSNLDNITIEKMFIEGTPPLGNNTTGVGDSSGSSNVRNITIRYLRIENTANGVSITCPADGVTITDNVVRNTVGTDAGWGYGIHSKAGNAIIARNFIENATRHSLYIRESPAGTTVIVEDNFILNHDLNRQNFRWYAAAFNCAGNLAEMRVANNIFMNCHAIGIAIMGTGPDVNLLNNQIVGEHYTGIWPVTGETHTILGNTVVLWPDPAYPQWCMEYTNYDWANGWTTSSDVEAPDPRWEDSDWIYDYIADLGDYTYVLKNGTVDKITPYTWGYSSCPDTWSNVEGMSALEDAVGDGEDRLYIVSDGTLYEVNSDTWVTNSNTTDWSGTQLMTAVSGHIYIMKGNVLYKVTPSTLDIEDSSAGWLNPRWMENWNDNVYLFDDLNYYEIDPNTLEDTVCGQSLLQGE